MSSVIRILIVLAVVTAAGCEGRPSRMPLVPGGDAARGVTLMRSYGCASCHTIPGVRGARGLVGPPLTRMGARVYVAGHLPNTPENLIRWIQHPQALRPGTAMPDTGVTDQHVRDIAAYLYTLK